MAEAALQAKAARLPSAQASVALLNGEVGQAFREALVAALDASVDDLARPLGTQGAEGTKQMLQRILTSFDGALTGAQARVIALSPEPVAPEAPAEASET